MSYFITGLGLGFTTAVIGALIDWLRSRHLLESERKNLPGCMFLTVGALGVVGVCMLGVTWVLTGSPWEAVVAGGGVIVGFFAAFVIITSLWLLNDRFNT